MSQTYEIALSGRKVARLTLPDELHQGDMDLLVLWAHNLRRSASTPATPEPR